MHYPASDLVIDPVLIRKYDVSGPRYTSYPTADRFVEAFGATELRQWLGKRNIGGISQPLSVYVHLPFCDTVCYYCACNKVVTRDHSRSAKYIKHLEMELALLEPLLGSERRICQIHWGGGTPTFLSREEMGTLAGALERVFERAPDAECSIEVDPRRVAPGTMEFLAGLGFNRVSIGVQDFDPAVQRAVHRVQSEAETRAVIDEARASGFRSVNLDLIYGLPKQTVAGFSATLDKVIALAPDRTVIAFAEQTMESVLGGRLARPVAGPVDALAVDLVVREQRDSARGSMQPAHPEAILHRYVRVQQQIAVVGHEHDVTHHEVLALDATAGPGEADG